MKITIEKHGDRLRLRWLYLGKRYTLAVGVPDNQIGRNLAEGKAKAIEKDLLTGHFDPTLLKYKPLTRGKNAVEITAPELFSRFTRAHAKDRDLSPRSIETRYKPLQKYLDQFLNIPAFKVTEAIAGNFVSLQLERVTGNTAKARAWLLQSCWEWAKGKYQIAESNPWSAHIAKIKPSESKKAKPFTAIEVGIILNAFKHHQYYSHYYPLVAFQFGTGCRFGEAVGLRWCNVADDFGSVIICQTISRGEHRNTTKTGKARAVNLSPTISDLLRSLKSKKNPKPTDLVFPSPKGLPIDDHSFNRRAWHKVLGELEIEYRKPYCTRHTAVSHALSNGANYLDVASQSGHNPKVMHDRYASSINNQSVFVEF